MPAPNLNSNDYYEILGCSKGDDDATLKKAYRKLAVKWHPDKNPDNEEATKNFQKMSNIMSNFHDFLGEKVLLSCANCCTTRTEYQIKRHTCTDIQTTTLSTIIGRTLAKYIFFLHTRKLLFLDMVGFSSLKVIKLYAKISEIFWDM